MGLQAECISCLFPALSNEYFISIISIILLFQGLIPKSSLISLIVKGNIFMPFRLAQCCNQVLKGYIHSVQWKVEPVGINTRVVHRHHDPTIMWRVNAYTHMYCLLSYMASTELIGLTVVEELAHNLVHGGSQAPP